jgi:hypothetical protein
MTYRAASDSRISSKSLPIISPDDINLLCRHRPIFPAAFLRISSWNFMINETLASLILVVSNMSSLMSLLLETAKRTETGDVKVGVNGKKNSHSHGQGTKPIIGPHGGPRGVINAQKLLIPKGGDRQKWKCLLRTMLKTKLSNHGGL